MKNQLLRQKITEHYDTQEKFAAAAGISESQISKYVRGHRPPPAAHQVVMSMLLQTPKDQLFDSGKHEYERDIQRRILKYLRGLDKGAYFFKVAQGLYSQVGVHDICGCYQGRFVSFEVKSPTGRVTKGQENFAASIQAAGGYSFIVRSVKDVEAALQSIPQFHQS